MNKEATLYGVIGLLLGIVLTVGVVGASHNYHMGRMMDKDEMHVDKRVVQDMKSQNMGMSMDDMTAALKDKKGDEFDKAFIEMMIEHHQGAIDMANLIPARAKHDEIKKLGQDIISAQTKEINEMKEWAKNWGYTTSDMPMQSQMMGH